MAGKTVKKNLTYVLSHLKTLDIRTAREIGFLQVISVVKDNPTAAEEFETRKDRNQFMADYQSVTDLLVRRAILKALLVEANATNTLTIGGKKYTVAAAIETKTSIEIHRALLQSLKKNLATASSQKEIYDAALERDLTNLRAQALQNSSSKLTSEEMEAVLSQKRDESARSLNDPLNLAQAIRTLEKEIEDFEEEVDISLSTFNASTFVDIPM
jgi:hypothetical protein